MSKFNSSYLDDNDPSDLAPEDYDPDQESVRASSRSRADAVRPLDFNDSRRGFGGFGDNDERDDGY